MIRKSAIFILACFCGPAVAQVAYKCTSPDGSIVFSQYPCGKNAQKIDVSGAQRHGTPSDAVGEIANSVAIQDIDISCRHRIDSIRGEFDYQIRPLRRRIRELRSSMNYSADNLAGATRDTGIQTQMSGLDARIAALESSRDSQVASTRADCETQKRAELSRQAAAKAAAAKSRQPTGAPKQR